MEVREAVSRILGQHWALILGLVLLGAAAAGFAHRNYVPTYTATVRFVIGGEDPKSHTESAAIADTARAIATSPSHTAAAIERVGAAGRDPVELSERKVAIRQLGTSAVLRLSVVDTNRDVAARLANELARRVIAARLDIRRGQLQGIVRRLDRQIIDLTGRIARARLGDATAPGEQDALLQRRSILETQRLSLLSTDALAAQPSIISSATPPPDADRAPLIPDLVLGMLLGLVLGVGIAGLLETLAPTLVGGDAVARELDTPWLASVTLGARDQVRPDEAGHLASCVCLAAKAAGVRSVQLLAATKDVDVRRLVDQIEALSEARAATRVGPAPGPPVAATAGPARPESSGRARAAAPARPQPFRIRAFDLGAATQSTNGATGGLVLVAPAAIKKAELSAVEHLLRVSPAPLLGLITYVRRAPLSRDARRFHPNHRSQR